MTKFCICCGAVIAVDADEPEGVCPDCQEKMHLLGQDERGDKKP